MGNSVSQSIDTFLKNDVSSTVVQNVISRYASETSAISTNTNNIDIVIGDEHSNTVNVNASIQQRIESYINVNQMIDRANKTNLTNDLVQAVSSTINEGIKKVTDGIAGLLTNPSYQKLSNTVANNMSSYVASTINTTTVDTLILSSSNFNNNKLVISGKDITANINFTQEIQAKIMAENIIKQVADNLIKNSDVQQLANDIKGQLDANEKSPVSTLANAAASFLNPRALILIATIAIGVIIAVAAIAAAILIEVPPKTKLIIGGAGIVLGIIVALGGILYYMFSKPAA
jgi:hypothetical protein